GLVSSRCAGMRELFSSFLEPLMFTKIFGGLVLSLGMLATGLGSGPGLGDCCQLQMACCSQGMTCCPTCCVGCDGNSACCTAKPDCCAAGEACCAEAQACCSQTTKAAK